MNSNLANNANMNMIFDQSKPNDTLRNMHIPCNTNDATKSIPNFSINSHTMTQMINPQTNSLVNNIPNLRPIVPPNHMFHLPYTFPVVNLGQNYVNNINFTQNFNNFNHFNNIPAPSFVTFNPYQQIYPLPLNYPSTYNNIMVPRSLAPQNFHQAINPLFINCNKSSQPVGAQENNISPSIVANTHSSLANPPDNNCKLSKKNESEESVGVKTEKKSEKDKGNHENDEVISNPTLSYIYGGHRIQGE